MLIGKSFIYFELHKTGCSHTLKILEQLSAQEPQIIGKHNKYYEVPKKNLEGFDQKKKIGNIRNPWDWYVSLWAFGCMQKGGLYDRVTARPNLWSSKGLRRAAKHPKLLLNNTKSWKDVYQDANDPELFRRWLKLILQDQSVSLGEGYKSSPISAFAGLLSYRYFMLYNKNAHNTFRLSSFEAFRQYDHDNNFMDHIIRNESIHADLLALCEDINVSKEEMQSAIEQVEGKTNASNRAGYEAYYDDESRELIAHFERLIIVRFDYRFEA